MTIYLDTSVVLALLSHDALSERAARLEGTHSAPMLLSDLAGAEFAAVIARRVRTRHLAASAADDLRAAFDAWASGTATRVATDRADLVRAQTLLWRPDLTLRTQDAIHIATAERHGAILATFDAQMATAARALGLAVLDS